MERVHNQRELSYDNAMEKLSVKFIQSVLVCEDHPFVQKGLEVVVRDLLPNLKCYKAVSTGESALNLIRESLPDLVLIDIQLPGISGVEVIEQVKAFSPSTIIFVITGSDNPIVLDRVKKLGVAAIIQKSSTEEHLYFALENLSRQGTQTYIDPYTRSLLRTFVEVAFTPKEEKILREIIQGFPNRLIAEKMGCSVTTVRFHRANILQKTGLKNAAELTAWYLQGQRKRD